MNYSTVYVGMDVHKESFSLCCYTNEKEQAEYPQKINAHYSKVINYLEAMRFHYGDDVLFICGYEAGCLGFTLYHELTAHDVKCVILAPTSMPVPGGKKRVKTDKRDAAMIARCLAHHDYSPVHIPAQKDEQVKEFIRMRDDHRLALKKIKQQILAFCLRHGYHYDDTKNHWTQTHLTWLRTLRVEELYRYQNADSTFRDHRNWGFPPFPRCLSLRSVSRTYAGGRFQWRRSEPAGHHQGR